jgi:hypothetical protein
MEISSSIGSMIIKVCTYHVLDRLLLGRLRISHDLFNVTSFCIFLIYMFSSACLQQCINTL